MKLILEILKDKGFDVSDYSNKKRDVIQINKIIKSEILNIKIIEKGKVAENKKGFKWNISISGLGYTSVRKVSSSQINPIDVLISLVRFFKIEGVREQISSSSSEYRSCSKCNGSGHLPSFDWYAEGLCFECQGTGLKGGVNLVIDGAEELKEREDLIETLGVIEQTQEVLELLNELKNIKSNRIEKYRSDKKQREIELENKDKEYELEQFEIILEQVKNTDILKLKKFIKENQVGFDYLMSSVIKTEGKSKYKAFADVMVDYYKASRYRFTIEEYARLMIEFGYNFKSIDEVHNMIYP